MSGSNHGRGRTSFPPSTVAEAHRATLTPEAGDIEISEQRQICRTALAKGGATGQYVRPASGVVLEAAMTEHDPATLLRFITTEIWCNRRYELIDELIS